MNSTYTYDMVALQMNEMRRESKRWKLAAEATQNRNRLGLHQIAALVAALLALAATSLG